MDAVHHQRAVEDVLESWRDPSHQLNEGRQLAPLLLGRAWQGEQDDARLVERLAAVVETALAEQRQLLGVAVTTTGSLSVAEQVRADLAVKNKRLEQLSMLWAAAGGYLDTQQLAEIAHVTRRAVQLKVAEARALVATLLTQQQPAPDDSAARSNGAHDTPPAPSAPAADAPRTTAREDDAARPPMPAPPRPQRSTQNVRGNNNQTVQGPIHAPVRQEIHTHHHAPPAAPASPPIAKADTGLFQVGVLLLLAVGFWIMQTVPWLGIGVLCGLSLWRAARHGWHTAQVWSAATDPDTRWWHTGYSAAWLGVLLWSIALAVQQLGASAGSVFGLERLMTVVIFLGISLVAFWLGTVDVLLWIDRAPEVGWPLRLLRTRAAWFWEQRWLFLGLTWLILGVFSAAALAFLLTL